MKISAEDLSAYFAAKNVRDDCPMCATSDWSVAPVQGLDGTQEAGEIALEVTVRMVKRNSWIPVLPLICQNCGFVRMHHTFWIEKWFAEKNNGGR
ncbi:MAG: hypothetical protein WCA85_25930 [Paraburkholderia sp.]|uniref:hypothetical protein n=1 Tax=Paraburkholderia sp. TaxID=1926495 RepID=UPI003C5B9FFA